MKLLFVSLGCDKNLVDSEHAIALLSDAGFESVDDENEADVIVVNTCCFILDAKQESIDTVLEMARLKDNKLKALIVCGCLAKRYRKEIQKEIPEVDAIIDPDGIEDIVDAVRDVLKKKGIWEDTPAPGSKSHARVITTPGHYEYLKIAEGCDKNCTYCIIPGIRGPYRSYPMEDLVKEAEDLARKGVKELIIVAQETTCYGLDLYGRKSLPELLCKLADIKGIEWIRLLYAYPEEITDELIEVMSTNRKICHYIDMPVQSGSDQVLRRMGRRTRRDEIGKVVQKLRRSMNDICIRTTLISGFPGETQSDHEETYRFVNETEFDRLGVFEYSAEEGTPAYDFDDQVDEDVKRSRREELYELQQAIAFEKAEGMIGSKLRIIIDGYLPEDEVYVGRSYKDAPDIDGLVFAKSDRELITGDMIDVIITGAREYDLEGEAVNESAK
ncbi:MAG: 30S ribosomal protein S12 methylthiotransferase RimO [Lachnospiraceae bacterium]|nr:30S ribosomal protein S12 methylthiotransferase RimO [Lachnospiraceae bacterium]